MLVGEDGRAAKTAEKLDHLGFEKQMVDGGTMVDLELKALVVDGGTMVDLELKALVVDGVAVIVLIDVVDVVVVV
jgi:hypothetical protein